MTDSSDGSDVDFFDYIKATLKLNGIEAPEADLASLAKLFPGMRRKVDRFYEVQTGDEVTAAVFRAGADSEL